METYSKLVSIVCLLINVDQKIIIIIKRNDEQKPEKQFKIAR